MGNAGSMDSQQTDFRAHNMPLKLPMPEPGELEERFAVVLVSVDGARSPCRPHPGRARRRQPGGDRKRKEEGAWLAPVSLSLSSRHPRSRWGALEGVQKVWKLPPPRSY